MRWTPAQLKRFMWMWPPYLGAGVRIEEADDDGTRLVVKHRLRPWFTNAVGTVFGGTMQSMTDPFFMILALHQLGPGYRVWDTEASIEFLKPGRGTVRAVIEMPAEVIEDMGGGMTLEVSPEKLTLKAYDWRRHEPRIMDAFEVYPDGHVKDLVEVPVYTEPNPK